MASRQTTLAPPAEPAAADVPMSDAESSDWAIAGHAGGAGDDDDSAAATTKKQRKKRKPQPVRPKDSDEEDLERLVLGDRAGFRARLFAPSDTVADAGQSLEELSLAVATGGADGGDDDEDAFEDADDAHMFLYDDTLEPGAAVAVAGPDSKRRGAGQQTDAGGGGGGNPNGPAWEDSDDERLTVSLAGRSQLRKLRRTEGEDIVNGTEYTARLRQQFLRMSPMPAWAIEADKARMKRLQQASGVKQAKEKRRLKKDKKDKKDKKAIRASRRRSDAGKTEESDADDDSDVLGMSDSSSADDSDGSDDSDASSSSSSSSAASVDGVFDLRRSALPLDAFLRSSSATVGASQLFAQGAAGASGPNARKRRLRPEVLDIQITRDIPTQHRGAVASLAFHPAYHVLLSTGTSPELHLHQIAPAAHPTPNPLLTKVCVGGTAVRIAQFLADAPSDADADAGADADADAGPQADDSHCIVFAGRRRYFHTWDLNSGKVQRIHQILGHELEHRTMERFRLSPRGTHMAIISTNRKGGGFLNILDAHTMLWVAQARQEGVGGIADFQWWRDGAGITILGRDGRVGEWRLANRRFVGVWRDSGSTGGTVLALGGAGGPEALGGDRWVGVGSKAGITNLYERAALVAAAPAASANPVVAEPTPLRVFEQLITPVTTVVFSPDAQLLAFGSVHKQNALRLAHLPSATVYRNWPTAKTPLGRITSLAFSHDSEYLAVGNDKGKTRLWVVRG